MGDVIVYRREDFGVRHPVAASVWPVLSDWGPGVVGGSVRIGFGSIRKAENSFVERQYQAPLKLFVEPRRRLLRRALWRLARRRQLPPGLWARIVRFVDEPLAASCFGVHGSRAAT